MNFNFFLVEKILFVEIEKRKDRDKPETLELQNLRADLITQLNAT